MNKDIEKQINDKYTELFESSKYFDGVPRKNLGLWSSYKALRDESKIKFDKYFGKSPCEFDDFALLNYMDGHDAKEKMDQIKNKEKYDKMVEKAMEENDKWMEKEYGDEIHAMDREYEERGLDPQYRHLGLDQ